MLIDSKKVFKDPPNYQVYDDSYATPNYPAYGSDYGSDHGSNYGSDYSYATPNYPAYGTVYVFSWFSF